MLSYVSFSGSPSFVEGWCPDSKAPVFSQSNSFATAPIIYLNDRSFTISCWIKQTNWDPNQLAATIYSDWHDPWQFFLFTKKTDKWINFQRHSTIDGDEWFSFGGSVLALSTWTHVAVTCNHKKRTLIMYADGYRIGYKEYSPGKKLFYQPTGKPYRIGNDGHGDNHQFYGLVMDLYVFGTALSLDEIDKLRGER